MGFRATLIQPYARYVAARVKHWSGKPLEAQEKIFHQIIQKASNTMFGKEHGFKDIKNYDDFKAAVPIRDYEQIKTYIDLIINNEKDVLWPGIPKYLAKTSGTTTGVKLIPITNASIGNHFYSAQASVLLYMAETGHYKMMDGKMLFLSGSPELGNTAGIKTGRLSGIVNHDIPAYLSTNRLPKWDTNCIEDWDTKLDTITNETVATDMSLVSGIPPWVQMYFDKLIAKTGKPIKDIFPNFEVLVYGGVNFAPYRNRMMESIGKVIPSIETYPASEGFFAYQDSQQEEGLLLNVNSGIFFEFVPANEIFLPSPTRLQLGDVQLGVNYALVISSNAGLWAYNIGDTVKFVSTNPYRIVVTGRTKHFTSAFGEHVIGEEVEKAMEATILLYPTQITEYTVAPQVSPTEGLPYHEWLVEFSIEPNNLEAFRIELDNQLRKRNIYYNDLIKDRVLQPLIIKPMPKNAFIDYMRSNGKLGGQNKVPRLSNDRTIAVDLLACTIV